jgi:hypothetical protein
MKISLGNVLSGAEEVLVRWECQCTAPRWACPDCGGEGIFECWVQPKDLLLMERPYAILSSEGIRRAA